MTGREWPTRGGRYVTEQLVNGKWSPTTINLGYETLACALASIGPHRSSYRVIDREIGEPIEEPSHA